ncbi:DMT family transporter [Inquilinus sp. CAU 1745]|uniref:DMT family transporter n=1 Tax=Inquilinus sp. CAU 1745 TaxID=3140369 RepID=UPI00325BA718
MIAAADSGASDVRRGILWVLAAMMLFVSLDTTAKYLSQTLPVPQVVWARYTAHALILVVLFAPRLPRLLKTQRLGLQLVRSFMLLSTTLLFFLGLSQVPLASASSIMFLTPIIVTALSVPLLKEQVGPRRWAGVLVGFMGAMIVIRPGADVLHSASMLIFAATFFNALFHITTRILGRTEDALTTLIYTAALGSLLSSLWVPFFWAWPSVEEWALIGLLGIFGAASQYALIKAFEAAAPVVIAPFNYTTLIWATFYGYVLFGDLPDRWTLLGAAIIVASGLYIFYRERVRRSPPPRPVP